MSDSEDVVLITVDSLRADHCGFMGYEEDVTPTLDHLAEEGLVFENAIAPAPETNSSVTTMFTGHYPNPDREWDADEVMPDIQQHMQTRRTLPERFRELGYETAGFTANPWTSRYFDFDRNFDHFVDTMDENATSDLMDDRRGGGVANLVVAPILNWWQGQDMFMSWERLYEGILEWVGEVESPYFLWIFLVDVHMPYLPPDEYRTHSRLLTYPANGSLFLENLDLPLQSPFHDVLVRTYDDSIRYTDAFLERFVDDIDGDPLIAIVGDHGEEFGENGVYGHGSKVSETALHVPFVVANGPSETVERPVSLRRMPELLTALATDGSYDHVLEPTVRARNYDPAVAVRGTRWRYEWRESKEKVEVRRDGSWEERSIPELERIGRDLVDAHLERERERKRIHEAATDVSRIEAL
ncbi:arylsulfatase [Halobiforma haloterrestris]|uniref:Arylsulfatase n=1 Tax=Natronobacterium haloterrestre TaxID=148448 RepID=A0A1I1F5E8_NATHA|nr:sulfatase [Halobiforma haloterrestris]SFB92948.1 arylsulfatase [Halobiforma haloterrestris]